MICEVKGDDAARAIGMGKLPGNLYGPSSRRYQPNFRWLLHRCEFDKPRLECLPPRVLKTDDLRQYTKLFSRNFNQLWMTMPKERR